MKKKGFHEQALDVLREVCSMSTGRVATALSELVKARVDLVFPQADFISFDQLDERSGRHDVLDDQIYIIETNIEGGMEGKFVLFLSSDEARRLASYLAKKPAEEIAKDQDLFESALVETMNIFTGSYSDVLCELTHMSLLYEVPFLQFGSRNAYFRSIRERYFGAEFLFSIDTVLKAENISFRGNLLLLLDHASIQKIFAALGQTELFIWAEIAKLKLIKGDKKLPPEKAS